MLWCVFAEIHGGKQMNLMLYELIRKVKTLKLQNIRKSAMYMLFKKWSYNLSQSTQNMVSFLSLMIFSPKKSKMLYSRHLVADTFSRKGRCPLKRGFTVIE